MIGRQLSHYRLLEKLGSGGMGEVYRARDEHLARDVALKLLPGRTFADERARRRFRREATALSRLNHPHIATIHDFDSEDGVDFLVMEYVDGTTLQQKLQAGPLPPNEVCALGTEIAEALCEAHEQGVVHRDLKPANIALTRRGQVKVLDFGLARLQEPAEETASTETRAVAGTLPYMSPETLRGAPPDERSDIYGLGVVLYELATGKRPFEHKVSTALADDILHQSPPPPGELRPGLPGGLGALIQKCIEKEPDRRYQSAAAALADLRKEAAKANRAEAGQPAHPLRRRAAVGGVLAAAALAIVAWLGQASRGREPAPPTAKVMLVVLPFDNLSPDAAQEYFSAGLTEELIAQLGQVNPERLGVIARTSAALYKDRGLPIDQIGQELGAEYVLEGTVRSEGPRVRITAQLVQVADQTQLWASSYERSLTSLFAIQSDVARQVTGSLAVELLPSGEERLERRPTKDVAAHEAYLKGRHYWNRRTVEGFDQALAHFEHAIALDPEYARAYSGLADTYLLLANYQVLTRNEALPKAATFARRALELDESIAEAHTSLAAILADLDGDLVASEQEFRRAIELNPSYALAHQWLAGSLARSGRVAEAIAEAETARALDPLNPRINVDLARARYIGRQYERALEQCRRTMRLHPDFAATHSMLGLIYLEMARYDEAIAEIRRGAPPGGVSRWLGLALARGGRHEEARRELAMWTKRWESHRADAAPSSIAAIHVGLGEGARALDWLERAPDVVAGELAHPYFDPIRNEPRFQALVARVSGLAAQSE